MRGLIIKDFVNLKKNLRILGLLSLLYGIMTILSQDANLFSTVLTMLFAVLTLSLYSYDDLARWDVFAQTLPVTKDEIVQGKYAMMLLLSLIGVLYSTAFTIIFNLLLKSDSILDNIGNIGYGAAVVILFNSILLPFVTKLGVEKARLVLFAIYLIPFVAVTTVGRMINTGEFVIPKQVMEFLEILVEFRFFIIPVVVIVALWISFVFSIRIYRRKEF